MVRALLPIQCLFPAKHKDENKALHSRDGFTPPLCNEESLLGSWHHQVAILLRLGQRCPTKWRGDGPSQQLT